MVGHTARRTKVFVSYSHQDESYLKRIRTHLKPLELKGSIDLWDDTRIKAGDHWRKEIEAALATAQVAVLLVSPDFLASDFINKIELPSLLKAERQSGVSILQMIVNPYLYELSGLNDFQCINPPDKPLGGMEESEREQYYLKLARRIMELLGPPSSASAAFQDPTLNTEIPVPSPPTPPPDTLPIYPQVAESSSTASTTSEGGASSEARFLPPRTSSPWVGGASLEPALALAQYKLAILEEQASAYTLSTIPVHLRIDLEAARKEVAELERRVAAQKAKNHG